MSARRVALVLASSTGGIGRHVASLAAGLVSLGDEVTVFGPAATGEHFDFAGTGKPIVFFTPDLAHYSTDLRGFYFDLLAEAPGPVVHDRDALRDAILSTRAADGGRDAAAASRANAWRVRFTPLDDGHAGERVVRRMLDAGWL